MHDIGYILCKMRSRLSVHLPHPRTRPAASREEIVNQFFRKHGVKIGERCLIYSNILTSDSYLIEVKDNVCISIDVKFVTHDFSVKKVLPEKANLFGKIIIGNNCFIGERATLLYGVELADNIIVASGSVVTKSFTESNIIIGGNPARKIGTWDVFREKSRPYAQNVADVSDLIKEHPEILIRR